MWKTAPSQVCILWALFLVRGSFYCAVLPLWEGWDEYAHFAWLQHWIDQGTLPRVTDGVSREIDESMRLASLPHELGWIGPPYLTHEQWWALPEPERTARTRAQAALAPELAHQPAAHFFRSYEAQQAPLYCWIVSVPLRYADTWPIARRVLLIRLLSCAIASFVIPATWFAARRLLSSGEALAAAAILAAAPGLAIDSARIANDCLAIAIVGVLTALLLRPERRWAPIGLALGAAFLTKAYLLSLLPGVAISWPRRQWKRLAAALLLAAALAAWWYIANPLAGRTIAGWEGSPPVSELAAGIVRINWFSAAQVWTKSFLWTGAWSFLGVKSWIYLVIEILGAIALAVCSDLRVSWRAFAFPLRSRVVFWRQ